jgi:hypothetical protein
MRPGLCRTIVTDTATTTIESLPHTDDSLPAGLRTVSARLPAGRRVMHERPAGRAEQQSAERTTAARSDDDQFSGLSGVDQYVGSVAADEFLMDDDIGKRLRVAGDRFGEECGTLLFECVQVVEQRQQIGRTGQGSERGWPRARTPTRRQVPEAAPLDLGSATCRCNRHRSR